ncbi:uncharacterized protein ACWYII_016373 isoform 4-T5 [Salvelinus alpinus]
MASVKESSQTLRLNIITKDIEEEVKIWECDDYAEESPEMASVKMADSSQTLGLNVTVKEEEKDGFGESDHDQLFRRPDVTPHICAKLEYTWTTY